MVRVEPYLKNAIAGCLLDPLEFQRGFLAALLIVYREGLSRAQKENPLIIDLLESAERLLRGR
jgi:hypothetical protein